MSDPRQPAPLTPAGVRSWLGEPRFARYTAAAGGDADLALGLYQWNAQATAAALIDVGHCEVALRNAYDRQLSHRFPGWAVQPTSQVFRQVQGRGPTRDAQTRMNDRSRQELQRARRGLGAHPTQDQVVAALSFGFWAGDDAPPTHLDILGADNPARFPRGGGPWPHS